MVSHPVRRLELMVSPEDAGLRVDTLLKRRLGLSGTIIRRMKWVEDGILVDGVRVNTRYLPKAGQCLSVRLSDPVRTSGIVSTPGPVDIVYEDLDLLVINKQAGVSVHPGPGHFNDTLGNFLLFYYDSRGDGGDFHPVHRLDKGTSGLLVVARHPYAQERLKAQLHTPAFQRHYLAICQGHLPVSSGCVDAPIGAKPGSLVEQWVCPQGKPARTHYTVLDTSPGYSLIQLTLDTGRTHQIRVHMAHLGHPLAGDFLYGSQDFSRPALHSHQLTFSHPITGDTLSFTQPLPKDMDEFWNSSKK